MMVAMLKMMKILIMIAKLNSGDEENDADCNVENYEKIDYDCNVEDYEENDYDCNGKMMKSMTLIAMLKSAKSFFFMMSLKCIIFLLELHALVFTVSISRASPNASRKSVPINFPPVTGVPFKVFFFRSRKAYAMFWPAGLCMSVSLIFCV